MKEGATAKAAELGIELMTFAGKIDGDHETQQAVDGSCIAAGAEGILITASDTKAITESLGQAREAGILVIALDTPLDPIDAADATFATDNREAGRLIGAWAAGQMEVGAAERQDRHAGPVGQCAVGRRAARSGLHGGLWHRREGRERHR